MRNKKAKLIRKKIGLKLPVKADLRFVKEVNKTVYFTDALGKKKAITTKRRVIMNAAKYQYQQIKKIVKGAK